jgi:Protein of unknown function (DUF2281)
VENFRLSTQIKGDRKLTSRRVGAASQIGNHPATQKRNGFGILKGKITIADDFDAPLEEIADYQ